MSKPKLKGRLVSIAKAPKRVRHVESRVFKELDLIDEAKELMAKDQIGVGQMYILEVPEDVLKNFRDLRAVARPIKDFVTKHYKRKYVVACMNSSEYGPIVTITQPGPG